MNKGDLLRELQLQELYLLHHDHRENPEQLDALIAEDFSEITPNGSLVNREPVIAWLLKKDPVSRWEMQEFRGEVLTPTLVMLVYHARQVAGVKQVTDGSWRMSMWRKLRSSEQWQMHFHQATPVR